MTPATSTTASDSNSAEAADSAFFERYVNVTPFAMILGQPTFQAYDAASRKPVLLRCFRLPWESRQLDHAIQFGKSKSPFAVRVKDLIQRPTETILVTNLMDLTVQDWIKGESVHEQDIERLAHQIGDWMMDWKSVNGREVALNFDTLRIGRTEAGRPYCRILGGVPDCPSADAITALRIIMGSILKWNQQRTIHKEAPDVSVCFDIGSSIDELEIDPNSWLGWLLADHPDCRPPSIGDWLLGENPDYRTEVVQKLAQDSHHELPV